MLTDRRDERLEFDPQKRFEPCNLAVPVLPDTIIAAGLAARFEMGDVFGELLDHRHMLGKWRQAWIRRGVNLLRRSRADRDQRGVDPVVLGPLQVKLGVGSHLRRLKNNHNKAIAAQRSDGTMIRELVALGADPNESSDWWAGGFRPVDFSDLATTKLLQELGAELTPHAAARLGLIDELSSILRNHPNAAPSAATQTNT